MLDRHDPFLYELVSTVGDVMGDVFPEIVDKQSHIEKVIQAEEKSFNETLDRGISHFEKITAGLTNSKISGNDAFKLYDTYGFPLDLTQLMARDRGLTVDEDGFSRAMAGQKERAKAAGKFSGDKDNIEWIDLTDGEDSEFLGYDTLESNSRILRYAQQEDQILVVLDQTPFYAESGGQVGDTGEMTGDGIALQVQDVVKENSVFIHICFGTMDEHNEVACKVDVARRKSIMKNHTAAHLIHKALKDVLGDHVNQAGSLVHPDYMRFDLTHFEKLTKEQIRDIENKVNEQILLNIELTASIKGFDEAKEAGAEALFGEKYGDEVRVIQVGDYSMELCGGTHVERTGDIGSFKILEESSLSSGVRRIMAITGKKAVDYIQDTSERLDALQVLLSVPHGEIVDRVEKLLQEKKDLEKKLKHIKRDSDPSADSLLKSAELMADSHILVSRLNIDGMEGLKSIGDGISSKLSSGIAVLFSAGEEKPNAMVVVTKDLNAKGILAGDLAREIGGFMEGGGGGKPHLATAGGKDNHVIDEAMEKTKDLIKTLLERLEV
jgi:alanyl-tRNA synthetase